MLPVAENSDFQQSELLKNERQLKSNSSQSHDSSKRSSRTRESTDPPFSLSRRSSSGRGKNIHARLGQAPPTAQLHHHLETKESVSQNVLPKTGSVPRPIGGTEKLGTFSGVFVPTTLNVLSILMFIRFGFILGQSGVIGMMGMLIVSYVINLVTTLSISAIATNGTVRGGGAYYLISRSLGPEFGGSIGLVLYLGFVLNTGMNAVGLVDCIKANFGQHSGNWSHWLLEGFWIEYAWATIILVICTAICLAGSGIFARCSNGLLVTILIATFSIPFSALVLGPSNDRGLDIEYTGLSAKTFRGNLLPKFTAGADGSQLSGKENFQDLFGVLFPATGGIFAGASMSGDLKNPSRAIPKGTLAGLILTFLAYTVVILALAATVTRESFYYNVNVVQDTSISGVLILLGEVATSLFSSLMGVIGSAKLLQALARDNLLPGFYIFGQGSARNDEPTYAIIITQIVAQLAMLCNINQIASLVTMTYLMTFLVTNLACFLLTISSAPNFRPSFHYFNLWTAGFGALSSGVSMFFVDGLYASVCVGILVVIFLIIHYTTPPKSWGDVSQSLIYHQVRKYLLRLRQEHVKFWRPQILLFVNDPRRQYELIRFCNSLKKGALFILGHVIVSDDFGSAVPEARRQQGAWAKYIELFKIKAFINIAISPSVEWGTRNIVLNAGLGGMRPNIVILGAYNLDELRHSAPLVEITSTQDLGKETNYAALTNPAPTYANRRKRSAALDASLPTDACKSEGAVNLRSYVRMLEDLLSRLQINVAIAKGFKDLEFPRSRNSNPKKYIDLWPIQMSAEISTEGEEQKQNLLTTNFDTYTLILQLGCILNTVPAWKKSYSLRVAVFVEYESDVEEEQGRVKSLLENLRIQAEVLVFWLASGELRTYQVIVNGDTSSNVNAVEKQVNHVLKNEQWWQDIKRLRGRRRSLSAVEELAEVQGLLSGVSTLSTRNLDHDQPDASLQKLPSLRRLMRKSNRRRSSSNLGGLGLRLGMRTHRLNEELVQAHASHASASEESSSDDSTTETSSEAFDSGQASPASQNDLDKYQEGLEEPEAVPLRHSAVHRRHSYNGYTGRHPLRNKIASSPKDLERSNYMDDRVYSSNIARDRASIASKKPIRPTISRQTSALRFSSNPVPRTKVATEDGPGPSIMFSDASSPGKNSSQHPSIYERGSSLAPPAFGYPFPQNIPISFNDLPCRAQHLILNELMQRQSKDTAVLFTTLPGPMEGTGDSEEESMSYLSDLEVLCADLPPVLLIHSNSMTVTMNL